MVARSVDVERARLQRGAGTKAQGRSSDEYAANDAAEEFDEVVVGEVVTAGGERAQPFERVASNSLGRVADQVDLRFAIEEDVCGLVPVCPRSAVDAALGSLSVGGRRSEFVHRPPKQIGFGRRELRETSPFGVDVDGKGRIAEYDVCMRFAIRALHGHPYVDA